MLHFSALILQSCALPFLANQSVLLLLLNFNCNSFLAIIADSNHYLDQDLLIQNSMQNALYMNITKYLILHGPTYNINYDKFNIIN